MKIAKTELQMLFYSPVAWLILIIFTFQSGLVFSEGVSRMVLEKTMGWKLMGVSTNIFVRVLYSMQEYLFLYIPILTMGLVSRDLAGGTMKLLHSSPMTNAQIILGKYLSMMIFALVLVGIFLVYLLFLLMFCRECRCVDHSFGNFWHLFIDMYLCGLSDFLCRLSLPTRLSLLSVR